LRVVLGTLMTTLFAVAEIDAAPVATTTGITAARVCPSPACPTCPTPQAYRVPVVEMAYEVAQIRRRLAAAPQLPGA
jgi:hypothetical protein